jgi:hypothetical protein
MRRFTPSAGFALKGGFFGLSMRKSLDHLSAGREANVRTKETHRQTKQPRFEKPTNPYG